MVAGLLDQVVQTGAFAAEDEDAIGLEVELGVVGRSALVETEDPDVLLFHLLECADEVGDAGDAYMLGGASGGFGYGRGDRSGAALGQDDSIDSGAFGGAEKRPEIVGVLDAVEREEEAMPAFFFSCEEVFDPKKLALFDQRKHPLMSVGAGDAGELVAGFERDANASGAAELDKPLKPLVAAFTGHADVVELAGAGADGLFDRVKAIQNFHS
jgi:hypothetical protein